MIELALVLALGAHAAPAPQTPAPTKATAAKAGKASEKPMEWKNQHGGPRAPSHQLISDVKGWEALWRGLGKDAPALDFKTHAAVAVFLGERPTGGWTVDFREPVVRDGDLRVVYSIEAPKGFSTQAFTAPYVVRAFAKPATGKLVVMETKSE